MGNTFTRPNILALLACEGAELFGQADAERISHTDALSCVEELLEGSGIEDDAEAWLSARSLPGVTIWTIAAYQRDTISSAQIDHWAEWHAECLREHYGEEYTDEGGEDGLTDAENTELTRRLREVVQWYTEQVTMWPCTPVASFPLDGGDVRELVEQLYPEWLNKPAATPSDEGP